ncbi:MAG: formylglycine-generating enzyme family protein [Akkermansiaceae bacterium]
MKLKKNFPASLLIKLLGSVIGIALITWIAIAIANRKTPPEQRKLPDMVRIPAGKYPGPDGNQINVREFWIDAHEVTIGEYASFLDDFAALRPENRAVYEHENQPKEKVSHEPDDWANLLAAAKEGTQWNTLPVDLNYPVVGIDWWDAHAYAEWKGRRLPSREQWYAACSSSIDPAKLEGTGWLAVDHAEHTPHGVYGLAGNVSEWTRERSLNPADLSQPKRHVLCGASYLKRKHGAMAREWVNDRNVRRPDLGFRTLTLSPQSE